jgi:hypothetical protein
MENLLPYNNKLKIGDKVKYIVNCSKYADNNEEIKKGMRGIIINKKDIQNELFDILDINVKFEKPVCDNYKTWWCHSGGFKKI